MMGHIRSKIFFEEIREAKVMGAWPDIIALKVAKSKLQGDIANLVRNRYELSHAPSFDEFAKSLTSALHTERPVSARLQELMTCNQHQAESVDAFSARIRKLAKQLPEWDLDENSKALKNQTATAAFIKGLKPSIRQHVLPQNPTSFEKAISLARTMEANVSFFPSEPTPASSSCSVEGPVSSAANHMQDMQALQSRVASLELAAALPVPPMQRGRGGRGRPFRGRPFSSRGRGYSAPAPRPSYYQYRGSSHCHGCHCGDRRWRNRSPSPYDSRRRYSRSGSRDRYRSARSVSRSPSPARHNRYRSSPSPNGRRSQRR